MSINQRQYDQLNEMGISLWQHKTAAFTQNSFSEHDKGKTDDYIKPDNDYLTALMKLNLFNDILRCLELSIGEVIAKKDHLDLGVFNWYFSKQAIESSSIHCTDNNLISPSIKLISQSPLLKKQLWHTITNNLL